MTELDPFAGREAWARLRNPHKDCGDWMVVAEALDFGCQDRKLLGEFW